jgi:flagellar motor switch protein FliG
VTKERIGNVLERFAKESTDMGMLVADTDEYVQDGAAQGAGR